MTPYDYAVTEVFFSRTSRDAGEWVPLADAWRYFEEHDYLKHPERARVQRADGETFETFAKGWFV